MNAYLGDEPPESDADCYDREAAEYRPDWRERLIARAAREQDARDPALRRNAADPALPDVLPNPIPTENE